MPGKGSRASGTLPADDDDDDFIQRLRISLDRRIGREARTTTTSPDP